ncbi:MAG: hypothetical protein ACE5GK_07160 [Nitrospiria bacterium]
MNTGRTRWFIGVLSVFLLFTGVHLSDATEIKFLRVIYDKSIERSGKEIIHLALLDSGKIRTQEAIGKLIVKDASSGRLTQAAAVAYSAVEKFVVSGIDRERGNTILRLSKAEARTADIIAREEAILGPAAIQKRIQAMNSAKMKQALIDAEELRVARKIEAKEQQVRFAKNVVRNAQVNWAAGEMGKGLFARVQGRNTDPIPSEVVGIVRSGLGFGVLDDFRLGLTLLENETGQPMRQLVPAPATVASSAYPVTVSGGWGGFAEFGFFSVLGFVFVGWMWFSIVTHDVALYEEKEEAPLEYKKAA